MKDFRGLEISVGDCVGFICIEGYDINIIKDRIRSIENRRACFENSSTSTLAMDGRFNKIVKIEDRKAQKNAATDAVGQPVSLGDKVVRRILFCIQRKSSTGNFMPRIRQWRRGYKNHSVIYLYQRSRNRYGNKEEKLKRRCC